MPLSCSSDMMAPTPPFPALDRSARPARHSLSIHRRLRTPWAVILAVFVCFASHALAATADASGPIETLVIDHRAPYRDGRGWVMLSEHDLLRREMQKRATSEESQSSESSKSSTPTSTKGSVTTTFSIAVGTQKPSTTSTTAAASPLPSILDSMAASSNGVGASCSAFVNSFLVNPTFKACYPLSMLFDGSKSFFEAQRSLLSITRTLDATCEANAPSCNKYLAELAQNLTSTENCGAEYQSTDHPTVVSAHDAMLAYAPIYSAGCLRDPDTSAYCYANAVTNQTNPSSVYFYRLPLNKTLPGTTVPGCGYCLQQTMAIYHAATADRKQMIALTYVDAAKQVNLICGPGFSNETLAAEVTGNGAPGGLASTWLMSALPLLAAALWLV